MFNNGHFNQLQFNSASAANTSYLRLVTSTNTSFAMATLKADVKLFLKQSVNTGYSSVVIFVLMLLLLKQSSNQSASNLKMIVERRLALKTADNISDAKKAVLITISIQTMSFEGLVIKPNQVLIIDTSEPTATLDGENIIEYWQTGSEPFELANGTNTIINIDTSSERRADMSVVWRNRYL
ncbi:MAG TPA: hypothetical protein DCP97_01865 [Ruminococcaceae bacterium]|nr:hypothetical protein [Oscillospiraceae bacterium]